MEVGGYTTRDRHRCRLAAKNVALVFNWWSWFVRLAFSCESDEAGAFFLYPLRQQLRRRGGSAQRFVDRCHCHG